jgi:hypothetical protein
MSASPLAVQPLGSFATPLPGAHVHRWRIAEQAGACSEGHCDCGEERVFQNGWEGDAGFGLRGGGWLSRREREAPTPN